MKHSSYASTSRERQALSNHLRSTEKFASRAGDTGKSYSFFNAGKRDAKVNGSTEVLAMHRPPSKIETSNFRGQYATGYMNATDCKKEVYAGVRPGNSTDRYRAESPVQYVKGGAPGGGRPGNNSSIGMRVETGESSRRAVNRSNILRGSLAQQISFNPSKGLNLSKGGEIDTRANRSVNTSQYFTMLWNHRSIKAAELKSKHENRPAGVAERSTDMPIDGHRTGSRDRLAGSNTGYLIAGDRRGVHHSNIDDVKNASVLERAKALVNSKPEFGGNLQKFANKTYESRATNYADNRALGLRHYPGQSREFMARSSQDLNNSKPKIADAPVIKKIKLSKFIDEIGVDGRPNHLVKRDMLSTYFDGNIDRELVVELVSKVVQYKLAFENKNRNQVEVHKHDSRKNSPKLVLENRKSSIDIFQQQKTPNLKANLMPLFNKTVSKKRRDILMDNKDGNMIAERSENSDIFFTGDLIACQRYAVCDNKQSLSQNGDVTRPRFDIDDDDASLLVELENAMKV